jgi:ribosomal subunit interface protein
MKTFDINTIQLQIQSPGITVSEDLENHLISQIEKLGKIFPRIKKCEILLRNENESHNRNCVAEAKLFIPGNLFFSKEQEENFTIASNKVFDDLHDQIYKVKDKMKDVRKKVKGDFQQ